MIYICIPCHNEERTIGVVLWKIRQVMADFPRDYQLLVLDDASTDGSRAVIERYTRVLPLTLARHTQRRGYGPSLEALVREAVRRAPYPRRDVVVTLQADFTEDPEHLPALIKRVEAGADVVVASAELDGAESPRGLRWARRVLRYVLQRTRWASQVEDPLTGYRAYRVLALRKALESRNGSGLLRTEGWASNVELLRAVLPHARRVDAVPVVLRNARRQRESRFDAWRTVRQVVHFVWADRRGRMLPEVPNEPLSIVERASNRAIERMRVNGEGNGAPAAKRSRRGGRGRKRPGQARATEAGKPRERKRPAEDMTAAAPAAESQPVQSQPLEPSGEEAAPKKKRRRRSSRRRRRSGGAAQNNGVQETAAQPEIERTSPPAMDTGAGE